jgi:hypothetical protein
LALSECWVAGAGAIARSMTSENSNRLRVAARDYCAGAKWFAQIAGTYR